MSDDLATARESLREWLGSTAEPAREAVIAALVHPGYRHRLWMARHTPEALESLLRRPPPLPPGAATMAGLDSARDAVTTPGGTSTTELLVRAAASATRWAASGFRMADEATQRRRIDACGQCPHQVTPPRAGAYRLLGAARQHSRICGLCGCVTTAKAGVLTEACPAPHPEDPELTRWGEPRRSP